MDIALNPPLFSTQIDDLARLNSGTDQATSTANADFESFLSLLTAQLRNQDPLQPLDSTEFVAQLANFSTVEQLIGTNRRLDDLAASLSTENVERATAWIGREISLTDGLFEATGEPVAFDVPPLLAADAITARVTRPDGTVLRELSLSLGTDATGEWDGLDASGVDLLGEEIRIILSYSSQGDEILNKPAEVFRHVLGVRASETGPILVLGDGGEVGLDRVAAVRLPTD
ncbi:MAG: flagellar hook assembly protein FlgD [Paracoccaceae bacterium]